MLTEKDKYRLLCISEKSIPVFCRDWWLDIVAGDENWDVALSEKKGKIAGALPYAFKKKLGFLLLEMPSLTQHLGIWLNYPPGQKYTSRLGYEKDIMTDLINNLPKFDVFNQNFHYSVTNWLPFYWRNFNQNTKYTYIFDSLEDLDSIFNNFKDSIRRQIRKAEKIVTVEESDNIEEFYHLNKMVFLRQNITATYNFDLIKKINKACIERNCRKMFFARDDNGQIHAAIYVIWDESCTYYLMGGSNPNLRSSGAMSLLIWEAIQFAAGVSSTFDFEGSILEPVERFFRSFGATQKAYHTISKREFFSRLYYEIKYLMKK